MILPLNEIEFDTRTIGPLVLTTPFLHRVGLREVINQLCPIADQADLDHGLVAESVVQYRLTDPRALYEMPAWATQYDIATLYPTSRMPANSMMTGSAACSIPCILTGR